MIKLFYKSTLARSVVSYKALGFWNYYISNENMTY